MTPLPNPHLPPQPTAAVDYSEGALLEARRLLRATAAFAEDARAYMRGQLAGGPVQEDMLWERWVHRRAPRSERVGAGGERAGLRQRTRGGGVAGDVRDGAKLGR